MEHQATEGIVHAIDRWSGVAIGLAATFVTIWVTLSKPIGSWLQRRREMAAVEEQSRREDVEKREQEFRAVLNAQIEQLRVDLAEARAETSEWRQKWSELLHEKANDAEKFVRALEKLRGKSSAPPPTSK